MSAEPVETLPGGATGDQLGDPAALVSDAKAGRVHAALGDGSWTAYFAAAGGDIRVFGGELPNDSTDGDVDEDDDRDG